MIGSYVSSGCQSKKGFCLLKSARPGWSTLTVFLHQAAERRCKERADWPAVQIEDKGLGKCVLHTANSWRVDFHGGFKTCLSESLHPVRKLDQKQELLTMPHVNSSGGDDLASTDEVKVYKDEGEEEKRSSENLSEDKLGLVTETEEVRSTMDALRCLSCAHGFPGLLHNMTASTVYKSYIIFVCFRTKIRI